MSANMARNIGKKAAAAFLTLALSAMMAPAAAFADDGPKGAANAGTAHDTDKKVVVDATAKDASVEVGNVTPRNGDTCIDADAADGHAATVKAGDLATENNTAIRADATSRGSIDIAAGNVSSADQDGVQARVEGEGAIKIALGNVKSGDQGAGIWASTGNGEAPAPGSAITVKAGNVTAAGEGIVVRPSDNATISVEAGNVKANGNGIQIIAENGASANVSTGDVAAGKSGIFLFAGEGSTVNVLVAGTLSGKQAPITFFGSEPINTGSFTLTAWKIDAPDGNYFMVANPITGEIELQAISPDIPLSDAEAAARAIEQGALQLSVAEGRSALEQSILYIMKLGTAEGATLSASYADGKPLATSHDYSVAKEGERVMLKVDLEEGCELMAAYDGNGNKVNLVKGEDGGYYIAYTVPKGGGLGLSVEVSSPLTRMAIEEVENALAAASASAAGIDAVTKGIGAIGSGASTIPKTGDGFPALPFAAVALLAAIALAKAGRLCRQEQSQASPAPSDASRPYIQRRASRFKKPAESAYRELWGCPFVRIIRRESI